LLEGRDNLWHKGIYLYFHPRHRFINGSFCNYSSEYEANFIWRKHVKLSLCLCTYQATNVWESGGVNPHIHNLETRSSQYYVSLPGHFSLWKRAPVPLNRKQGRPQILSGWFGKEKIYTHTYARTQNYIPPTRSPQLRPCTDSAIFFIKIVIKLLLNLTLLNKHKYTAFLLTITKLSDSCMLTHKFLCYNKEVNFANTLLT
jgi:hypothetical protein